MAKTKWSLRDKNVQFTQTWKIECYVRSYTPEIRYCNLCATEKYLIVKNFRNRNLVNDRSEIISSCRHQKKFLLSMALKKLPPRLISCKLSEIFEPLVKKNCLYLPSRQA